MRTPALLLAAIGLAAAAGAAWWLARRADTPRWNVVLLTLDTTRADFLGCYGSAGATPNLDALAAAGTRFDQAIASASVTPVSHASILTGLDNREHGVRVLAGMCGYKLAAEVPTLATILKASGYATAAVHSAFPVSAYYGFDHGFDVFESFEGAIQKSAAGTLSWPLQKLQRRSDDTTNLVIESLAKVDDPFFLWVHYWDPHDPVLLPPAADLPADLPRTADGQLAASRELYAAEVRYLDAQIGRLFDALKQSGEWEHTLVVVVADHGEGLGDHGWAFHRILYQEQIRVPLLVRLPGVASTPSVAGTVRTTDIAPTVLDYLGVKAPRAMSGRTLRPLLEGRTDEPRTAYADQVNGYDLNAAMLKTRPLDDFLYAVVDRGWKLVWRPLHPEASELYHLDADPQELDNRLAREPAQLLRLQQLLARHASWVTAPCHTPEDATVDVATAAEILAKLGYAGGGSTVEARWGFACPEDPARVVADPLELDCETGWILVPAAAR